MGMPAVSTPYWTAAMVRELPDDGKRYECIDGELLVTPSPGTASRDRGIKRAFYQRIGVGEYWIVHPASRLVERWRSGATAPLWEDGTLTWQPEGAAQALVVGLPALFDAVPEQFRTP